MKFASTDTLCNRERDGRGRVVNMRLQKQQEQGVYFCVLVSLAGYSTGGQDFLVPSASTLPDHGSLPGLVTPEGAKSSVVLLSWAAVLP